MTERGSPQQRAPLTGAGHRKRMPRRADVMREAAQYEAVLRSGFRISSRNFVLRAGANGTPAARLGIIAGKKAARRAVDRNRVKRLVREVFRSLAPRLGAHDVTIQLRSDLRSEDNGDIRVELSRLLDSLLQRIRNPAKT